MSDRHSHSVTNRARGFTLVEALIATLMAALIAVLLINALRISQRSYDRITRLEQAGRDVSVTQRALRRSLESASAEAGAFHGTAHQLSFEAMASAGQADVSMQRYTLELSNARADGQQDLLIRWSANYPSTASEAAIEHETLLENVVELAFRYLGPAAEAASAPAWRESWSDARHLPQLIKIEVRFPPGDTRRWPALVIAPLITQDALCEYDVVAQDCRSSS